MEGVWYFPNTTELRFFTAHRFFDDVDNPIGVKRVAVQSDEDFTALRALMQALSDQLAKPAE